MALPPLLNPRAATGRRTFGFAHGGNAIDPLMTKPAEGNYAYRPGRGYVHQIGAAPRVNAAGLTQAQQNGVDYLNPTTDLGNWHSMFPNSKLPTADTAPPANDAAAFRQTFANNGAKLPPSPLSAPTPAPAAPPVAETPAASPPPSVTPPTPTAPDLTPQQTQYGTITPMHTWQQSITAKYPAIGQAGSPEHQSFLKEFAKHGDPQRAMETADQIMSGKTAQGTPMPGMVNEAPKTIDPLAPY